MIAIITQTQPQRVIINFDGLHYIFERNFGFQLKTLQCDNEHNHMLNGMNLRKGKKFEIKNFCLMLKLFEYQNQKKDRKIHFRVVFFLHKKKLSFNID